MPRVKKSKAVENRTGSSIIPSSAVVPSKSLTASAHRYTGAVPRIYSPSTEWQKRCYHHYQYCGEARYAANYYGRALGRTVLFAQDANGDRVDEGPAADALNDLFGGPEGQAEMMEQIGIHMVVAGECYLVGRTVGGADIWEVVAVTEIESGGQWRLRVGDGDAWVNLAESDVVIRIWKPNPAKRWEADSPFRSLLPVLEEIEWLTRYTKAQMISRIATAGMVVAPDNITFPPPPPINGKEQEYANDAAAFMAWFGSMMMDAIQDPDSPEAMVPGVLLANPESIDSIKHLTFWTELDEKAQSLKQDAIHRFALGMDLPPEMILGMSSNEGSGGGRSNGVSHWGAWMIEESTIKMHIEPPVDAIRNSLTVYYLRPLVAGATIGADTSKLRLRPDRSQESIELADRGWLKVSLAVQENGFDPARDMPDDDELRKMLLLKLALQSSATPEALVAALSELGVNLDLPDEVEEIEVVNEAQPTPSLEDHPTRPRTPEPSSLMAYDALVLRALERAGNRLKNILQARSLPGEAYEAHVHLSANGEAPKCLEGAWGFAGKVLGEDADSVVPVLDSYCRALMQNREPHTHEALAAWCEKAGI